MHAAKTTNRSARLIGWIVGRPRQLVTPSQSMEGGDRELGGGRNRRALLTGGAATLARLVQIGTSLITVPLALRYLGNERFGLWMTISSVLAMAAFADFGIGNGVLNTVARAFGEDDLPGIRRAVSSGFALLNGIAISLLVAFFTLYHFVNWGNFFRVTSMQARSEAGPALAVFAVCFALNISMDVVQRVQLGLQQGYRYGLWQLCGSAAGLVGVLTGIWLHVSLPVLVMAIAGAPIFATALNAAHFFGFVRPELRPSRRLVSSTVIFELAKLGSMFFVLQVVVAVSYSADNFIIARSLGAVSVPEYSIPQRLFTLLSMMTTMLVSGLWPAYGEAISRGHIGWVRRTLGRSMLVVFALATSASALLLFLAPTLIHIWVGTRIHPPFILVLGLSVWCVFDCCGGTLAVFMNGASAMRLQIVLSVTFAVVCVTTKIVLTKRFGIAAVPWSTVMAYSICEAIPLAFLVPRVLRNLEANRVSADN